MHNGIYPTKATKSLKFERPWAEDVPQNWLNDSSRILGQDKGILKLRARNDSIRAELAEMATDASVKMTTHKAGDRIFYYLPDLGITVNLVNS